MSVSITLQELEALPNGTRLSTVIHQLRKQAMNEALSPVIDLTKIEKGGDYALAKTK